jgi:hypothetical protein
METITSDNEAVKEILRQDLKLLEIIDGMLDRIKALEDLVENLEETIICLDKKVAKKENEQQEREP